jgi:hypothetical protein
MLDRQTEPLVLDSEISGLDNLHAYLKHGNYVARFSFPVLEVPATQQKFIERLKDDYIVREPKKEPSEPAKETPPPKPSVPAAVVPIEAAQPKPVLVVKATDETPNKDQAELAFGPRI